MIVTNTTNASGGRRIYLGAKGSLECWVEPDADGIAWSFHLDTTPSSYPLPPESMRAWATHMLLSLANELNVPPTDLRAVPFERIAALHTANPLEFRRIAAPRRLNLDHAYMATMPNITRPQADFSSRDNAQTYRRR